jgi:Putative MetA-pathway of phenol degradation
MLRRILLQEFLILLISVGSMSAQTAAAVTAPAQARDPIELKLQEALRERDAVIRNLLERVSELERRLDGVEMTPSKVEGKPVAASLAVSPAVTSVVSNSTYDKTERQATEALDQALIVRGGLLLPSGTLEIDNTTSYFSASSDHLTVDGFALLPVLVVGEITSQRVRQNYLLPTFTARLGLPHKFQMDFRIPYGYEQIEAVDANNNETSSRSFGLGDIATSLSRQITTEHGRMPDIVANVLFKSTTGKDSFNLKSSEVALGTGFNAWQGNLTMAKSNDPLVFFGNLFYTANLAADHTVPANDPTNPNATTAAHIKEGNATGFQIGSILALNPETSMTMGWDQRFTRGTRVNGVGLPSTSLVEGTLRLGMSYLYAPGRTIDLSFGVGLTPDTPNLQFSVGLPFRISLWGPQNKKLPTK